MRIAVISDIHGNLDALEAVLADLTGASVDQIVCLGDLIGYGAEPEAVIRRIRALNCPTVMGNHELAAIEPRWLNWFNPAARRSMEMTLDLLEEESLDFIRGLPMAIEKWGGALRARFSAGIVPALPV